MFGRFLGRLIVVPFGFVMAGLTAAVVLVVVAQEKFAAAARGIDADTVFGAIEPLLKLAMSLLSVQTVVVPILLVIVGEVARIRHPAYYVVGTGAALTLIPLVAKLGVDAGAANLMAIWPVFATAGFAGGLVYWLLAGRRA